MKKATLMLMGAMMLAGCTTASQTVQHEALTGSWQLSSVDGEAVEARQGIKPGINFSNELRVTGVMCNRFSGKGKLENGVLSVPQMISTRMLCREPKLNQWERAISDMLTRGAKVKLEQKTLTLEGAGHTLVYVAG